MMQWVVNNKEWVFSGIGVIILTGFISIIKAIVASKKKKNVNQSYSIKQINKNGENNTQIGIQNNCGTTGDKNE